MGMCYEKLRHLVSGQHVGRGVGHTRYVIDYNPDVKNSSKKPEASEQMHYHGILGRAFNLLIASTTLRLSHWKTVVVLVIKGPQTAQLRIMGTSSFAIMLMVVHSSDQAY